MELARRVGREGYGRIEFSFNIVFWLIFMLRDGVELVFCREVARRPAPKPLLVNAFLSLKLCLAVLLWLVLGLGAVVVFRQPQDRFMVCSYGALLLSTALGLDNVFRGRERPGIVALSLVIRSALYAIGVWVCVKDSTRLTWVPWILFCAEFLGIMLVWLRYSLEFGLPRPRWRHGRRFGAAVLAQGRSVLGIQLAQVILASLDVVIVGLTDSWSMVGLYGAPHRIVTVAVTFGLIFQQVLLPHLVRSTGDQFDDRTRNVGRIVGLALMVMVPGALFTSLISHFLIETLFSTEFDDAWPLLAIGIWRVPLLAVSSIHITTLIASHRERECLRIMLRCLLISIPLLVFMHFWRGLIGTSAGMVFVALNMAIWTGRAVYLQVGVPQMHGKISEYKIFMKSGWLTAGALALLLTLTGLCQWPLAKAERGRQVVDTGQSRTGQVQNSSQAPGEKRLLR